MGTCRKLTKKSVVVVGDRSGGTSAGNGESPTSSAPLKESRRGALPLEGRTVGCSPVCVGDECTTGCPSERVLSFSWDFSRMGFKLTGLRTVFVDGAGVGLLIVTIPKWVRVLKEKSTPVNGQKNTSGALVNWPFQESCGSMYPAHSSSPLLAVRV